MAYVTLDEFKAYIGNQQGTTDNNDLTACLSAAERSVENYCQRSFAVAGASSSRVYMPNDTAVQPIHDCTAVSAVTVSGSTVATTEYQLEPLNSVSLTGSARPYTQIRRLWSIWPSWGGQAVLSVTATWGWAAVPDEVKEAVRLLAKDILLQRQVSSGVVGGDFSYTVRLNPYVKMLLGPLRRAEAFGIA